MARIWVPLGTTSDVACKMYDATLTQLYGLYDDPALDGVLGTSTKMEQADPAFFLGQVLKTNLNFGGPFSNRNPTLQKEVDDLKSMFGSSTNATNLEKLHLQATEQWTNGHISNARKTYESILNEYPLDRMALKLIYSIDFHHADEKRRHDVMNRAMSTVNDKDPISGYLHGMYGFALCEVSDYSNAEKETQKGLDVMQGKDVWALHSMAHVFEMQERNEEGIRFLKKTEKDWFLSEAFTTHLFWHEALYHFDENDFETTLDIYDREIVPRLHPTAFLAITDAASLLYRIKMLGGNVEDRWDDLFTTVEPLLERHSNFLQDIHLFLICASREDKSPVELMKRVLEDYRDGDNERYKEKGYVLMSLYNAIEMYNNEQFADVVDMLYPLKEEIVNLGGSQAQRDLFNLMLITAAFYSPRATDRKLAKSFLQERKKLKSRSPVLEHFVEGILLHDA